MVNNILGFGKRLVIWVSGCPFRCKGCIAEEFLDINKGKEYKNFLEIIEKYLDKIDGITFSGGEPLFQAKELLEILEKLPENLDKMLFTGFYKNELDEIQLKCYNYFDLVVEGRFEIEKQGNFLFRGSSNQIFSSPTKKYSSIIPHLYAVPSAGLEVVLNNDEIMFYGIPTQNNEIEKIEEFLVKNKVILKG